MSGEDAQRSDPPADGTTEDADRDESDAGIELSLGQIAFSGSVYIGGLVVAAFFIISYLVAILFWTGAVGGGNRIPTSTLFAINAGLTIAGYIAYIVFVSGYSVGLFVYGHLKLFNALAHGDWKWVLGYGDDESSILGLSLVVLDFIIIYAAYLVFSPAHAVGEIVSQLWGALALGGLIYVLLRVWMVLQSIITSVSDRYEIYRQEAAAGASYEKGLGYYLLVVAIGSFFVFAGLRKITQFMGTTETTSAIKMVLVVLFWFLPPLGIVLDTRKTGLYKPYKARYVYAALALLPFLGWLIAVYYMGRRQWNAYKEETDGRGRLARSGFTLR